jgi:hypothetical protein
MAYRITGSSGTYFRARQIRHGITQIVVPKQIGSQYGETIYLGQRIALHVFFCGGVCLDDASLEKYWTIAYPQWAANHAAEHRFILHPPPIQRQPVRVQDWHFC